MSVSPFINNVETLHKAIAFTFDDGPHPIYTPEIIKLFEEFSGKATFYMVGEEMQANPELVTVVKGQGHEIGNHTFTHPFLTQITVEESALELEKSDNLIKELTGESPQTFRPPYFDYNDEIAAIAKRMGYQVIGLMNHETKDWEQLGVEHIINTVLDCVSNGSVFLFHDGYGDRSQTVEAMRFLLPKLSSEGYRFVTISELLAL